LGDIREELRAGFAGEMTTLADMQWLCGFSNQQAADFCFVSVETYRRWRRDRPVNPMALRLLAIRAGYMPWDAWRDWTVFRGQLWSPGWQHYGVTPGEVTALPLLHQLLIARRSVAAREAEHPPLWCPQGTPTGSALGARARLRRSGGIGAAEHASATHPFSTVPLAEPSPGPTG
jgi:hypothetical protein